MDVHALMKGWCPVHDHVYEAADGLCPRCGSALEDVDEVERRHVDLTAPDALEPTGIEDERPPDASNRSWSRTAAIVAAVAVAFAVGLAFPRGGSRDEARTPDPTGVASLDLSVGRVASDFGVGLRLESFTQQGAHVVARFTVASGDVAVGSLREARVVAFQGEDKPVESTLEVRTTVSGFIIEGDTPIDPAKRLTSFGIRSLLLTATGDTQGSLRVDLTGVWPATERTQPRARRASGTLRPGDGRTMQLVGLVGWAGRLEASFATDPVSPGRVYTDTYILEVGSARVDGILRPGTGRSFVVVFPDVPSNARAGTVRIFRQELTLRSFGGWGWNLTDR